MTRNLLLAALLALASFGAYATDNNGPSIATSTSSSGAINNSVATHATVQNGTGTSYSAATGTAGAYANSNLAPSGVTISGQSTAYNTGTAYNVSTGVGTGSASSQGWADSQNHQSYTATKGNSQSLVLNGSTDSGGVNQGLNGTDISVIAGTNQGGYAGAHTAGAYSVTGQLGSTGGGVSDTKSSVSEAYAGGYTNVAPANVYANAGTVVNASGSFNVQTTYNGGGNGPSAPPGGVNGGGSNANNGFGNGDQVAPGKSLPRNNAENAQP